MGFIRRPHGIRGELGVDWKGESLPEPGDLIYLGNGETEPAAWVVAASRNHNGQLLLSLKGLEDRTSAEKLAGSKLYLPRDAVPPAGEDEAFVADLPGCQIFLPDGALVGELDHVEFPGGKMIWAIKGTGNAEILFPAEPQFISDLDMERRRIVIDPPEGLLEIYGA